MLSVVPGQGAWRGRSHRWECATPLQQLAEKQMLNAIFFFCHFHTGENPLWIIFWLVNIGAKVSNTTFKKWEIPAGG